MNDLARDGRDVSAWDPAINAETRVSNQFDYVRHIYPHLEPVVDALPNILSSSPAAVLDEADVIVVTQATDAIRRAVASRLGKVRIIDLVRLFPEVPDAEGYTGIGW
jgi:GDP-mannose 6-dehydrogenase